MTTEAGNIAKLDSNQLSYERTLLAHERTLMAWLRTSISMISFGFTLYKFFEELKKDEHETILTPRIVGMIMIGFGLVALFLAQIQHRIAIRQLKTAFPGIQRSISSLISTLILLLGLLMFFGALLRQ